MAQPIGPDKRDAIIADLREGDLGRNEIARKHGVGAGTVTRLAQANEIPLDRAKTKKATEAVAVDTLARLTALEGRLAVLADAALTQTLASLGSASTRDASIALGISLDKLMALRRHNSGSEADQVGGLLGELFDGMRQRRAQTEPPPGSVDL